MAEAVAEAEAEPVAGAVELHTHQFEEPTDHTLVEPEPEPELVLVENNQSAEQEAVHHTPSLDRHHNLDPPPLVGNHNPYCLELLVHRIQVVVWMDTDCNQ